MGDFLSNLTARTFQPTEQVQPRLSSRFEPARRLAPAEASAQPVLWESVAEIAADDVGDMPALQARPPPPSRLPDMQPGGRRSVTPLLDAQPSPTDASAIWAATVMDTENPPGAGRTKTTHVPFTGISLRAASAPDLFIRHQDETMPTPADVRHRSRAQSTTERLSHAPTAAAQLNRLPQVADQPEANLAPAPTAAMPLLQQRPTRPEAVITPLVSAQNRFAAMPTNAQPTQSRTANRTMPAVDPNQASAGLEDEPTLPTQPSTPSAPPEMISQPSRAGLLTPPIARRASPLTALVQGSAQTSSAPTINVTIGRIEVRATPAPTSAAKPAAAKSATLSLDDYLRRRGQGGAQ